MEKTACSNFRMITIYFLGVQICRAFTVIMIFAVWFLVFYFSTEFHAVARIPADVIVKLVCRCLSINRKMLVSNNVYASLRLL